MAKGNAFSLVALGLFVLLAANPISVESSIGVCYGMIGDNLPSPSDVVRFCQSKGIRAMRIYFPDQNAFNALKGTGINLAMDVPNDVLPSLANDASAAARWVQNNVLAHDGVSFKYIVVGNELFGDAANNILPAMSKIWDALCSAGRCNQIQVSTAVSFSVVKNSYPPSKGEFGESFMFPIVNFLKNTGNPLMVSIYPYFSYVQNQAQIPLDYALFTSPGPVFTDGQYQYQNLFDAMVDSVYSALEKAEGISALEKAGGIPAVEKDGDSSVTVVPVESGWATSGEVGATLANAQTYNQNLINHVRNGTPKRPGNLETYIFAMFNENKKEGDEVERHFGLFNPDLSPVYPLNFN
ncbi:hypothetical protein LUZ63_001165 [Rhynchospora breviuscula]|uniref:Uncharacterized protein n=1 Tax=Rhynchospora breviuscula TaxID=2022672 RepID=A0A9Q0CWH5_9POAL|nr:hypothetical protein LUZ63_001165 [Rhynchospora breviuscula]